MEGTKTMSPSGQLHVVRHEKSVKQVPTDNPTYSVPMIVLNDIHPQPIAKSARLWAPRDSSEELPRLSSNFLYSSQHQISYNLF
jgi:hypothetical protein